MSFTIQTCKENMADLAWEEANPKTHLQEKKLGFASSHATSAIFSLHVFLGARVYMIR